MAFKPYELFRQDVYAFALFFHFIFILDGWLERGTHLFARFGAFNEPLWKVAHSHTRPLLGSGSFRAYQPREMTHTLALEAFHPFTHTKLPERRRAPRYHTQYVHLNAIVEDVMEIDHARIRSYRLVGSRKC